MKNGGRGNWAKERDGTTVKRVEERTKKQILSKKGKGTKKMGEKADGEKIRRNNAHATINEFCNAE